MSIRTIATVSAAALSTLVATAAMADEAPAAAAPAAAAPATQSAVALALRVGYALPMGESVKGVSMSDAGVKGAIPLTVDALYNFSPSLGAGLYVSYGIVQLDKDKVGDGTSASWLKYGAQLRYNLGDAFLGYGIGMEKVSFSNSGTSSSISGLELAHVLAGYNFTKAGPVKLGAFVDASYGQYSSTDSGDISDKSAHEWLQLGIAGQYDL